jgi:hypothetical protein
MALFAPSPFRPGIRFFAAMLVLFSWLGPSRALVSRIAAGPEQIYLQVGHGQYNVSALAPNHSSGATAAVLPTVNQVSVTVAASQVGSGIEQRMASDSTFERSFYDGFKVCNAGSQVYVGAWSRAPASVSRPPAQLTVNAPPSLSNGSEQIPFDKIRWESTALGDATAHIAAGRFVAGGSLTLASVGMNRWVENCLTFYYRNDTIVAPGAYTGRVTYTLAMP